MTVDTSAPPTPPGGIVKPRAKPVRAQRKGTPTPPVLATNVAASDWQDRAACAATDPDTFFSDHPDDIATAKHLCRAACGVRAECLAWAVETRQPCGVWGGFLFVLGQPLSDRTERDRRAKGSLDDDDDE